jgi:hypothetical protein
MGLSRFREGAAASAVFFPLDGSPVPCPGKAPQPIAVIETTQTMIERILRASLLALSLTAAQAAQAKDPAAAPAPSEAPATKTPSAGQSAARERQKKCGAEWRALTDAQKAAQGPKWPQFWSQCNKRLKGNDKA